MRAAVKVGFVSGAVLLGAVLLRDWHRAGWSKVALLCVLALFAVVVFAALKEGWTKIAALALSVLLVLGWLTYGTMVDPAGPYARGGCVTAVQKFKTPPPASAKRLTLVLESNQEREVNFGRAQNCRSLVLTLKSSPNVRTLKRLNVRVDAFKRDDDARLTRSAIIPRLTVTGEEARLVVYFGRKGDRLGDPGLYNGSVTLRDPRLANDVTIPITVKLQFVHGWVVLWLLLLAALPGTWFLWVIQSKQPGTGSIFNAAFLRWLSSIGGISAIVGGSAVAFAVLVATYFKDPTWGASTLQVVTLYGSMFAAFVATATIVHAGVGGVPDEDTRYAPVDEPAMVWSVPVADEPVVLEEEAPVVLDEPEPVVLDEPEPEPVVVLDEPEPEPEPVVVLDEPESVAVDEDAPAEADVEAPRAPVPAAPNSRRRRNRHR